MTRPGIAIAAGLVLLLPLAGCTIGGDDTPRVPAEQREAIESAFAEQAQRLSLPGTGCFSVTRPVTPGTRGAYALLLRVAREDPDAVLTNGDAPEPSRTIRQTVARRARVIDTCVARYPEADPSWAGLSREMWATLAEMDG